MKKSSFDEIRKEIEEIDAEIGEDKTTEKYNKFANFIMTSNYVLFITIVWKSFDLNGNIPFLAKASLFLFWFGIIFSAIRWLADYFSEALKYMPQYRRLIKIQKEHGEQIRKEDRDLALQLDVTANTISNALTNASVENVADTAFPFVHSILSLAALIISTLLFTLGLTLLGLSAW